MQTNRQYAIREEAQKNRVATACFGKCDCDRIVGNIDFCVSPKGGPRFFVAAADVTKPALRNSHKALAAQIAPKTWFPETLGFIGSCLVQI